MARLVTITHPRRRGPRYLVVDMGRDRASYVPSRALRIGLRGVVATRHSSISDIDRRPGLPEEVHMNFAYTDLEITFDCTVDTETGNVKAYH